MLFDVGQALPRRCRPRPKLVITASPKSSRRKSRSTAVARWVIVEKDGEVLMEIPCLKLDSVLLYGNIQFTSQA